MKIPARMFWPVMAVTAALIAWMVWYATRTVHAAGASCGSLFDTAAGNACSDAMSGRTILFTAVGVLGFTVLLAVVMSLEEPKRSAE